MAGISSKALNFGEPENKKKFTGQMLDDDFGLNWYQFRYRSYDVQIGRFVEIDPIADKYPHNSTYAYAENRVVDGIDQEGLEYQRYMSPRDYDEIVRSYRQINSFVPNARSYRNSGTYIPNQAAGSAPKPADIYEPMEPGSGQQFVGPTITKGNNVAAGIDLAGQLMDAIHDQIESVTTKTDNIIAGNKMTSTTSISIVWKTKAAENTFNKLQGDYDSKVKAIQDKYPVPEAPGPNATQEQKAEWFKQVVERTGNVAAATALLGPSPQQQILNSVQIENGDFKKVSTKTEPIAEIRQVQQNY